MPYDRTTPSEENAGGVDQQVGPLGRELADSWCPLYCAVLIDD